MNDIDNSKMCIDPSYFLFGYCGGMWIIFLYQTYKSLQRRQRFHNEYVDRLRILDKIDEAV